MTTNAKKTDAQRLGNGKKAFNVKQIEQMLESKQDVLTAGENITIVDNVISATSGSSGGEWVIVPRNEYNTIYDSSTNKIKKDIIINMRVHDGTSSYGVTANNTIFLKKDRVLQNDDCISANNTFVYPYTKKSSNMYKLESSTQLKHALANNQSITIFTALYSLGTIGTTPSLNLEKLSKLTVESSSIDTIFEVFTQS